jgi:Septum formation
MARCPEPGCHNGVLHFGGGPLHEQQQTGCPTCRGTGQVPDAMTGGGGQQQGCLVTIVGKILGWILLGVLAVVGFVVLSVGGYLIFSEDSPFRGGGAELEAAPVDPSDSARGFSIGTCLDEPFAGDEIVPADCGQPHGGEVFAIMRVERTDSDDRPRGDDFHDLGAEACQPLHDTLVAIDPSMGDLFFTTGYSNEQEWQAGDRFIMCLLIAGRNGALLPPGQALPR